MTGARQSATGRPTARSLLLLAGAVLTLTVVVLLIASSLTVSRNRRDVRFGIEQLDVLIEDGDLAQAEAMTVWLAGRATTVSEALRVVRRSVELADLTGRGEPLVEVTDIVRSAFPGNTTLRDLHAWALGRGGRAADALALLETATGESVELYAWALLVDRVGAGGTDGRTPVRSADGPSDALLIASLGRESGADELATAWRLTGDWRYAVDAVLVLLAAGEGEAALALTDEAVLAVRAPRLGVEVLTDRGEYARALEVAELLQAAEGDPLIRADLLLRQADLYLYLGRYDEALGAYERLEKLLSGSGRSVPAVVAVNRAWLDPRTREQTLGLAVREYPDDWSVVSRYIRDRAGRGESSGELLLPWLSGPFATEAALLALVLDPLPDRRGHAGTIWTLIEADPASAVLEYGAWYFASRRNDGDLALILDRAVSLDPAPAWVAYYRGMLAASRGAWAEAGEWFAAAFRRLPDWRAAYNGAVALYRAGDPAAQRRLDDALLLAGYSDDPQRVSVYTAAARMTRDRAREYDYLERATAANPADAEALMLRSRLENPTGR